MKLRLLPIPHIIIWNFEVTNPKNGITMENHYFLTRKGAKKFIKKHSDKLNKEGYSCGYGGEPLWFW